MVVGSLLLAFMFDGFSVVDEVSVSRLLILSSNSVCFFSIRAMISCDTKPRPVGSRVAPDTPVLCMFDRNGGA